MLERVPFRRKWLRGYDLEGNKYFERMNPLRPGTYKRLVQFRKKQASLVDYEVPSQWNSWLRYIRLEAPTVEELELDRQRMAMLEERARQANEKWKEVPLSPVERRRRLLGDMSSSYERRLEVRPERTDHKQADNRAGKPVAASKVDQVVDSPKRKELEKKEATEETTPTLDQGGRDAWTPKVKR